MSMESTNKKLALEATNVYEREYKNLMKTSAEFRRLNHRLKSHFYGVDENKTDNVQDIK